MNSTTRTPSFLSLLHRQQRHDRLYLLGLLLLLLLAAVVSLCAGESWLWPQQWLDPENHLLIWQLRLPRIIAVMVVGGALAVSGAVMQALFDNPLAEPGLLGISNGAGVVLVLTILLGHGTLGNGLLSLAAILGALLITALLLVFSLRRHVSTTRLLLIGVALSMISGAVMTWAVYFSSSLDLRQLLYWLMGGFNGIDWRQGGLVLLLLPSILLLCIQGRVLNLLALGERSASQLGLPLRYWRNIFVLLVGWAVGVSVALAGVISFIGLLVPHLLRLAGITDHRYLLPACILAGASILLLADLLARTALHTAELPVGVVTATLGAPLFIWMLLRKMTL